MRIIAIDTSGSNYPIASRMLRDAQDRFHHTKDAVVFYDTGGVTKAVWLAEASSKDIQGGGGDGTEKLIEWMDGRSFMPTDELVIYTDAVFDQQVVHQKLSKTWFKISMFIPQQYYEFASSPGTFGKIAVHELPF